jgi:anti-anti-sigma regulatory factor
MSYVDHSLGPHVRSYTHDDPSAEFELHHVTRKGRDTLVLVGQLVANSASLLSSVVAEICSAQPQALVLELGGVTLMDAAGVAAMRQAKEACAYRGCGFALGVD